MQHRYEAKSISVLEARLSSQAKPVRRTGIIVCHWIYDRRGPQNLSLGPAGVSLPCGVWLSETGTGIYVAEGDV